MMKRFISWLCALVLACVPASLAEEGQATPKYVFMFIGDGMGNPLVTATQYYLGSIENPDSPYPVPAELSFTNFPYLGMVTTYDASSFCPDSASTATSMASGEKTLSGVINYDVTLTTPFKLITEYAKEAGKKIGVVSSVSVDHATPAAYYAKQPSRNDYYEIAVQGITGDAVDFLAGGGFKKPTGANKDQTDILELARENGWTITGSNEEVRSLNAESGRVLAVNPVLQDSKAIHYEIDRERLAAQGGDILSLADFVSAGIRVLDNENGFFLMCEGGKIDWAGHANDAATSIHETMALSDAVQVAVETYYGLTTTPDQALTLTEGDVESLRAAWDESMKPADARENGAQEQLLYGGYEPFSMAVSHIMNNKAGLSYTSYAHTGLQIPVYAMGVGAERFSGLYDNTDIFSRTMEVMGLSK